MSNPHQDDPLYGALEMMPRVASRPNLTLAKKIPVGLADKEQAILEKARSVLAPLTPELWLGITQIWTSTP